MTDTQNSTGLDAAVAAFETILTGGDAADTGDNAEDDGADQDAEAASDEGEAEAQQLDESEGDETPDREGDESEGSDDAEGEADGDDGEAPAPLDPLKTKVTVRVDGKAEEITLDEAVKGYQRQADYSRKTGALAEERRSFEAEREAVRRERAEYAQMLTGLESQLAQAAVPEPDWRLLDTDPVEFTRQKALFDLAQSKLQAAKIEKDRLASIRAQEERARLATLQEQERERLFEARPEWKDKAKWSAAKGRIVEFAKASGFTDRDLTAAGHDHRLVLLLHKAASYDALTSQKPRPAAAAKDAPKPAPVSGKAAAPKPASDMHRAKQRLARSGSVADAASVFEKLL